MYALEPAWQVRTGRVAVHTPPFKYDERETFVASPLDASAPASVQRHFR